MFLCMPAIVHACLPLCIYHTGTHARELGLAGVLDDCTHSLKQLFAGTKFVAVIRKVLNIGPCIQLRCKLFSLSSSHHLLSSTAYSPLALLSFSACEKKENLSTKVYILRKYLITNIATGKIA